MYEVGLFGTPNSWLITRGDVNKTDCTRAVIKNHYIFSSINHRSYNNLKIRGTISLITMYAVFKKGSYITECLYKRHLSQVLRLCIDKDFDNHLISTCTGCSILENKCIQSTFFIKEILGTLQKG